jgi:hypothetical protein
MKIFLMFLKWKTLIHSYVKLKHEQDYNATWIEFRFNRIEFKFLNWIQKHQMKFQLKFNSTKFNSNLIQFN